MSLLAAGKADLALPPIDRALEVEDAPAWKADGLLDRSKALLALGRTDEAMKATEDCQALRPEGRVNSEIRLVQGDIHSKRNDPGQAYEPGFAQFWAERKSLFGGIVPRAAGAPASGD